MEWTKEQYNKQYESWVPWLEDIYLRYFTRDNKASYTTRENLAKTKLTSNPQADALQDSVNDLVANQVGQDGLARPVGDTLSREGINRAERQGRDERGGYIPPQVAGGGEAVVGGVKGVGDGVGQGVGDGVGQGVGDGVGDGAGKVKGAVGGLWK